MGTPGQKRQAPQQLPKQQPPQQRQSPAQQRTSPVHQGNKDYVAPHRRSGSITRTSTYMGAHGPQSIRGSRSLSRDPPQGQQPQPTTRSSSRGSRRRPGQQSSGLSVTRERPMTTTTAMSAQPMARNQSMPVNNNNQSVYQHQP